MKNHNCFKSFFNNFIKWFFSPSSTEIKLIKNYALFIYKEACLKEHISNSQ
jgi:hypothetical protein